MEKKNFFTKNKSLITFLILEIVGVVAFDFVGISSIFSFIGGVLAVIAALFMFGISPNKKELIVLAIPVALLFIVSGFASFGQFSKMFKAIENVGVFLAIPGFFILGAALRKFKDVKSNTVIFIVGGAIAALCLFNLFSTVIEYGFFYSLIYRKTPNYYFNGVPYDVTKEMFSLIGIEFKEVFIEHGSLFAIVAAAYLSGLFFYSPKENSIEFKISLGIGSIGLATLLVIPNLKAVAVLAVSMLLAVVIKYLKNYKKAQKIIGISFISIVGIGVLFFVLALINSAAGYKFPGFLDKLFASNTIMGKCCVVFDGIFADGKSSVLGILPLTTNIEFVWQETGVFEVELLKECGLIATFIFLGFLVFIGYKLFDYLRHGEDSIGLKIIVITTLLAFFIYESLFNIVSIFPHDDKFVGFLRNPLLFVMLFLIGYVFDFPRKDKVDE